MVDAVDAHRGLLGLARLAHDPALADAAVWKSRHMAAFTYLGHDDPSPPVRRTWADRIQAAGWAEPAGENIAAGFPTADAVVRAWLASPGHRANIERADYGVAAVACAPSATAGRFWTHEFGVGGDGPQPARPSVADDLDAMDGEFARSTLLATWRGRNPGEAARLDAYRAGGPWAELATPVGRALMCAARARR